MKIILKILKWIGLSIVSLLLIIILSGLAFRLFGPKPPAPLGELIDVGGFKLHINCSGEKGNQPTLVVEGGAGLSSEYYHWLSEGLKDHMRVVRYDRAGIGQSDLSNTPRDPETIARELHTLLEKAGESPPYIMAGHSLGGPFIRVFAQLYPDDVAAMVFMDCTHPDQVKKFDLPLETSYTWKAMMGLLKIQAVLGDLGVIALYDQLTGPILGVEGLPDEMNQRMMGLLLNGKHIRGYAREMKNYYHTLVRSGKANDFGALPIRVFTATEINREAYQARGINPGQRLTKRIEAQKEFAALSTKGTQILIDGNHATVFSKKENAAIICKAIMQLMQDLEDGLEQ